MLRPERAKAKAGRWERKWAVEMGDGSKGASKIKIRVKMVHDKAYIFKFLGTNVQRWSPCLYHYSESNPTPLTAIISQAKDFPRCTYRVIWTLKGDNGHIRDH